MDPIVRVQKVRVIYGLRSRTEYITLTCEIGKSSVLIAMPMKVRLVVGPTSLSSAMGTPKVLKVDLNVVRSS